MRWFINSTKESAGFNDNNFQAQIDNININLDAHHNRLNIQRIDLEEYSENFANKLHDKGIEINNILKHQGSQDERIDELERNLLLVMRKIDDFLQIDKNRRSEYHEINYETHEALKQFENRVKALEYQNMPKPIPYEKPKRERIANSYADEKYSNVFKIAMGYWMTGMKQEKIADKLNAMNFKTPTGKSFNQGNVSDLLANRVQKQRFMEGKEKKAKL